MGNEVGSLHLEGHTESVQDCCWIDSRRLVSCSLDSTVRIWDVESQQMILGISEHSGPVTSCCVNGKLLTTTSHDGNLLVIDYTSAEIVS